jgi:hypothetical protein
MLRFAMGLMLIVSAPIAVAGCWPLFTPVEKAPAPKPAINTYTPPSVPPPTTEAAVRKRTTHRRSASRAPRHTSPPVSASAPADNTNKESGPSLSLAGEADSKVNTEEILDRVDRQLAVIDRTRLTPADAATYDQASGFASSAHRALANHDYVVASGLADKASALTSRLNPQGAPP